MDVDGVDVKCGGCAVYLVPAFTKTTGLIANPRGLAGSRISGNEQLCLVSAGLVPPVVGASGLYRTPRSARYVYLFYCECIKSPRRGGLPRPPVLTDMNVYAMNATQLMCRLLCQCDPYWT